MSDLTEFLLARIAEDEAAAKSVQEVEPKSAAAVFTSLAAPTGTVEMSPARVLAECEAKRRIVELHGDDGTYRPIVVGGEDYYVCRTCRAAALGGCETLRSLALPYADHPDYRDEWRP